MEAVPRLCDGLLVDWKDSCFCAESDTFMKPSVGFAALLADLMAEASRCIDWVVMVDDERVGVVSLGPRVVIVWAVWFSSIRFWCMPISARLEPVLASSVTRSSGTPTERVSALVARESLTHWLPGVDKQQQSSWQQKQRVEIYKESSEIRYSGRSRTRYLIIFGIQSIIKFDCESTKGSSSQAQYMQMTHTAHRLLW